VPHPFAVFAKGWDSTNLAEVGFAGRSSNRLTAPHWCRLVDMATAKRVRSKVSSVRRVRRSVSLPVRIANQVETIARQRDLSDNRVLVELIEQGIEASRQKEKAFFELAERFRTASDREQVKQLGDELGRFVFGE